MCPAALGVSAGTSSPGLGSGDGVSVCRRWAPGKCEQVSSTKQEFPGSEALCKDVGIGKGKWVIQQALRTPEKYQGAPESTQPLQFRVSRESLGKSI